MIKDTWIYQQLSQDVIHIDTPWALYLVMEYGKGKRKPSEVVFDVTVYSEEIDNATHSQSVVGISNTNIATIVNDIEAFMTDSGVTVTSDDHVHLQERLLELIGY